MGNSNINKVTHLRKQCAVVIRKPKLRIFDEYEALVNYIKDNTSPTSVGWETERKTFRHEQQQRFRDIIFDKGKPSPINSKVLEDPGEDSDYWYLVANGYLDIKNENTITSLTGNTAVFNGSSGTQLTDTVGNFSINSDVNNSVISVSVEQKTDSAWSANVTLDNTNDIYYLKNQKRDDGFPLFIFQDGDCVIESNDEIDIYLTDWNSSLKQVFTGYVNSVSTSDNGLQKRITLECEDCTKKLSVSRTNINPSLDPEESSGDDITPFVLSYALSTPEDVIKMILGTTYCNVLTDFTFISSIKILLQNIRNDVDKTKNLKELKERILQEVQTEKYMTKLPNGTVLGYEYTSDGMKRLKFVIEGINQPAWAIEFNQGGWDYLISQWKGNDEIINDIVGKVYYEFYANENGVIHIRPTNLSLPKYMNKNEVNSNLYNETIENYILSINKELYVRNFSQSFNDRSIFTDIVVTGAYVWNNYTNPFMRKLVTGAYKWRKQFGTRMAPQETKIGAITVEQLKTYGDARLRRHNSEAWNASISMEGNSRISAGKPMFIERWQSVYYISNVNHTFTAGDDYSTTITLNNRRKPIDYIEKGNDVSATLSNDLFSMVNRNEISLGELNDVLNNYETLQWGTITIPDTINGIPNSTTVNSTEYNIIWESIPTIFDPGKMQSSSTTAVIYNEKLSEAWQDWQNAVISKDPDIELYKDKYDMVLNSAKECFGTDLQWSQFDSYRKLIQPKAKQ